MVKHVGKKPVTNFKQWLFTIATNLYRDDLRKRKIRNFVAGSETTEDRYGGAGGRPPVTAQTRPAAEGFVIREALNKAVKKLTHRQRAAFVLVYVEGFKIREAGEILGKSEGTVKSTLYRALEILRVELKEFRHQDT